MDEVQIIPFSGKPLEFELGGAPQLRFHSSDYGFLIGQENGMLEPLIQEIIDGTISPQRQPILLYGTQGSGRTHILKGILETWRKNQPSETIRRQSYYSTFADFARNFTESIASRSTEGFRRRCCRAKLLLLDDLEHLLGKPHAQTELRLLLDSFEAEEGVVVMTSQTLPPNINTGKGINREKGEPFSAELVSRLQRGTTIPIFPPGEAVRQRFLRDLASALRIPFLESTLNAAVKELTGTIPQLYGAVVQKYVEAKSSNEPIDETFWQQFVRRRKPHTTQDLTDISKRAAAYFALKIGDLKGQSRCKTVALARSVAVYLAKSQLQLTFKEIGLFFGKRDPSTVRHMFGKVRDSLQTDMELRDHLFRLENTREDVKRR